MLCFDQGARDCISFMHRGSCSFGAKCLYNHPEPWSIGKDKSMRKAYNPLDLRESGPFQLSGNAPGQQGAPWISNPVSPGPFPFQDSKAHHSVAEAHWRSSEPNLY